MVLHLTKSQRFFSRFAFPKFRCPKSCVQINGDHFGLMLHQFSQVTVGLQKLLVGQRSIEIAHVMREHSPSVL